MNWKNSRPLVSQKESSVSWEGLLIDWNTAFTNLYSTNFNVIFVEVLLCLFRRFETIKLYLLVCSMISKYMELFHCFHFFAVFRFICDINYLFQTKSTCTSYDTSDVILFTNIMKKQITFWELFLHFLK